MLGRNIIACRFNRVACIIISVSLGMPSKDVFFRFYANLPINVRKEVVLKMPEAGPITWEVAYREISAGTPLGDEILEKISKLGFLPND